MSIHNLQVTGFWEEELHYLGLSEKSHPEINDGYVPVVINLKPDTQPLQGNNILPLPLRRMGVDGQPRLQMWRCLTDTTGCVPIIEREVRTNV